MIIAVVALGALLLAFVCSLSWIAQGEPERQNIAGVVAEEASAEGAGRVTVIVLTYKRPQNLQRQLAAVLRLREVGQVIVLHGHPVAGAVTESAEPVPEGKSVDFFQDYENNARYVTLRRFAVRPDAIKHEAVLFLDDDQVPNQRLMTAMARAFRANPRALYGPFARRCDSAGYSVRTGRPNYVLTGLALTSKSVVVAFQTHRKGLEHFRPWVVEHRGECEDLAFNWFVLHVLGYRATRVGDTSSSFTDSHLLDGAEGFHQQSGHWGTRSEFCRMMEG